MSDSTAAPPDDHRADTELLDEVTVELGAVESALARLEDGSYWTCELCGAPIQAAALESEPLTTRCADHRSDHPSDHPSDQLA